MNITNIKIREVQDKGSLKAYIQATINDLSINDIKLVEGQKGLFISMPSREYIKDNEKKYSDIVFLTKEQKTELLKAVLHQMNGEVGQANEQVAPSQFNDLHTSTTNGIDDQAFADFGDVVELSEDDIAF